MKSLVVGRRAFLRMCGLISAGVMAAACTTPTQPTSAPEKEAEPTAAEAKESSSESAATAAPASKYQEAPMLAQMVEAGDLPPIEERLPVEPLVVGPGLLISEENLDWEPGTYGGALRFVHAGVDWNPDIFIMDNENLLAAPGIGLDGLYPNLVQSYDVSDDNTEFTFTLRKGLKWSDGVPVTTEDVRFTFEDVYGNEDITPTFPQRFRDGGRLDGEPVKLTIVDDFTWKLKFNEPYGGLLREVSVKGWQGYTDSLRPSHFLKKYHIKYTPLDDPEMQAQLKRLNLTDEWWQVFANRNCNNWDLVNPRSVDYPVLYAWRAVEGGDQLLRMERNPYYWKVDTEGRQLPYVDTMVSQQVMDMEALMLKVLAGEVDYIRESTGLNKLPLYKQNEESAGISFNLMDNHVDPTALFINYAFDDPVWREVVRDVRFRQALTHGLNRKEILDSLYYGLGEFPELIPSEYDVEKANQLLDDMGLDQLDADGFRIGPDGNTFLFPIEHHAHAPDIGPVAELMGAQWAENLKLKTEVKQYDSQLGGQLYNANERHTQVSWMVQPMWADGTWTDYVGTEYTLRWYEWMNTQGETGEEPPEEIKELWALREDRTAAVPYSDDDVNAYAAIRQNWHDNIWTILMVEKVPYAMVYNSSLGNIAHSGQAIGCNYCGEQFFFKS